MSVHDAHWSSTVMISTWLKRLLRALTAFLVILWHDPIEAHAKITEILGIRG